MRLTPNGRLEKWVFPAHPLDQISQATVNLRPPYPIARFPAPEHFESSAVPPQNRIRLNHLDRTKQARPEPGHPYEQGAIAGAKPRTTSYPTQGDIELMPQKQILGFKPTARLEQVGDEQSEPMKDRKHRSQ